MQNPVVARFQKNDPLSAQSMDFCAEYGSIDCASRSMDIADPQIAPNTIIRKEADTRLNVFVLSLMRECGKYAKMRDFPHDCRMIDTYGYASTPPYTLSHTDKTEVKTIKVAETDTDDKLQRQSDSQSQRHRQIRSQTWIRATSIIGAKPNVKWNRGIASTTFNPFESLLLALSANKTPLMARWGYFAA